MRKIISKASGLVLLLPSVTGAVSAGQFKPVDPVGGTPKVENVIVNIINFILNFSAALAVLFIIIGGVMYITSSGDEKKVEAAKKILTSAVIGLIIILLAIVIVNFVSSSTSQIVK